MDLESFNLREFVESLDLTVGLFRLARIEPTTEPNVITAFAKIMTVDTMPKEVIAQIESDDMAMAMWVAWMPEHRLLRFSTNLDLGPDSADGERIDVLIGAVNYLNFVAMPRIAKAFVHQDEDEKNIGTAAWTISVPPSILTTPEGTQALRDIVSENMARLYREAAVVSLDLHSAMHSALSEEPGETEEAEAIGGGTH